MGPKCCQMWGWSLGRQPRDRGVGTCSCLIPTGGGRLETDFKRVALNLMNRVSAPGQRAQRRPWPGSEGVREGHKLRGLPDRPRPAPPDGWPLIRVSVINLKPSTRVLSSVLCSYHTGEDHGNPQIYNH